MSKANISTNENEKIGLTHIDIREGILKPEVMSTIVENLNGGLSKLSSINEEIGERAEPAIGSEVSSQTQTLDVADEVSSIEETAQISSVTTNEETEVPTGTKQKIDSKGLKIKVLLFALIILIAVGAFFMLREKKGQPVATPKGIDHSTHQGTGSEAETTAAPFRISPDKQQLIGVQYGTVEYQDTSKSLRAVGRVAYDETKIIRINPKIEGWVEQVYVDFTGKQVKKGQPLLTIYSPDLVQTQTEYLLALRGKQELSNSEFAEASKYSASLVESARRRLELWDVSQSQIAEVEKRGTPTREMTLYSPADGFVLTRGAFPRQRITPDTELYALADLSKVWVMADVYEFEAANIREGMRADVTLSSFPGRTFHGRVTYINPQLESSTRTLKVRVELPNPGFQLKPDMYADVTLHINGSRSLVVPAEAVMDSGSEQMVFVGLGDGYFESRKVTLGGKVDNKYIITSGLKAGEQVVTSGNFLIDSESRLKSATGNMGGGHNHGGAAVGESTSKPSKQSNSQNSQEGNRTSTQQDQGSKTVEHEGHQSVPTKSSARTILFWYDPMHPQYRSDKPGKAPDCGMDLVPKYSDED
jgi:membrane fusion protein, copper/silver efflux system